MYCKKQYYIIRIFVANIIQNTRTILTKISGIVWKVIESLSKSSNSKLSIQLNYPAIRRRCIYLCRIIVHKVRYTDADFLVN